jgi:hypothetical protein
MRAVNDLAIAVMVMSGVFASGVATAPASSVGLLIDGVDQGVA